jgi:hypothetical protein
MQIKSRVRINQESVYPDLSSDALIPTQTHKQIYIAVTL